MIKDIDSFKNSVKLILQSEDGLCLESEGNIFIRTTEGDNFFAGYLCLDGGIEEEIEFGDDIDAAIEYFLEERKKQNHGAIIE